MISLTAEERKQVVLLHHQKTSGKTLTEADESLLARFYEMMDTEEATNFAPAREKQEQRIAVLDRQIRDMEALVAREAAFVERLTGLLSEATQERLAILREKQRILKQAQMH